MAKTGDLVEPSIYALAGFTVAQYGELLDAIYRGPLEEAPWSSVLESVRVLLNACSATLILRPPTFDRPGSMFNMPPRGTYGRTGVTYNSHYHSLDPFVDIPPGTVTTVDKFVGSEAWCRSPIYQELLKGLDMRYVLGADIQTADGVVCRFRLCRGHDAHDFSERDLAICLALLPHIKRAVDLYSRIDVAESERSLYEHAVDRMLIGMVVLDDQGMVLKANTAARTLLGEDDGIRLRGGRFELADTRDRSRFRELLRRSIDSIAMDDGAAAPMVEAMSLARPSGTGRLEVLIRAIPMREWSDENKWCPACVVVIRDPACSAQTSVEVLRQLFDFTPTEASLALLMANGSSLEDAARSLKVKSNTVRAHLRAIFQKAGVTRQAELVRTLLNSVLPLS
ncbi:helix-turn-helix transcriptional regulator [Cupriavidus alkaliphilus]|uniref:helix-turn-helix transcriptional regulator n=1 Tax=Cupriavidus alkaliphilus TaxID=942866 RepID=UPI001621A6E9|nr:LuxR C-terminal-related transcriptional regulator [Cupriavidus alkaliphilus]MBB3015627.1 DNA-binding CsgD family transcriptional regulator/PAS domain-containing protein [Cupriavidus alkaliphilus]